MRVTASGGGSSAGTGEVNWIVTDHLGTPRMVADLTGSLAGIKRHDYLPFGEEIGAGVGGRTQGQGYVADNVRQQFTSKERDTETGLDSFGERYYSSSMGRFTTVDPLGASARIINPQTMNRYAYVLNNPLRYIDPDGLKEKDAWEQLSGAEQKAITSKLVLKKGETVRDGFNKLVGQGGTNDIAANIQSVKNFIAQAGGLKNSETWQHITSIVSVNPQGAAPGQNIEDAVPLGFDPSKTQSSDIEIKVDNKDAFLKALQSDPANRFSVDALGDEALKAAGASWHPFNNARAETDYRSDPQLHYANDKSNQSGYGPNHFMAHWDPTSSNGRQSTFVGNARGGLGHGARANVSQVTEYLKRTKQAPE